MNQPFVSCLCPTYCRPRCLANALACFLAQDYPLDRRELIILDDAGQYEPHSGLGWELVSINRRFRSLPEKYNALAGLAKGNVLMVWEDDDIYLPWHISAHVAALKDCASFSKPSRIISHFTGRLEEESSLGRFHGSIAFTRTALDAAQGWPLSLRADFDQHFLTRLLDQGSVVDPLDYYPCSYIFRWDSTGDYHGQSLMTTPGDETWYARARRSNVTERLRPLAADFDDVTRACFREMTVLDHKYRAALEASGSLRELDFTLNAIGSSTDSSSPISDTESRRK